MKTTNAKPNLRVIVNNQQHATVALPANTKPVSVGHLLQQYYIKAEGLAVLCLVFALLLLLEVLLRTKVLVDNQFSNPL